jgi:transposase
MDEKTLFSKILRLHLPWFIEQKKVVVNEQARGSTSNIGHEPDIRVRCPECGTFYGMYDHAPERIYRHLNTCQMETPIFMCVRHESTARITG